MESLAVATAMDEGFALPVGVLLASVALNLDPDVDLDFFILEHDVRDETKRRVEASASRDRVAIHWIATDIDVLADILEGRNAPAAVYFRLLLPELIPSDIERIVYLDGDIVVLGDLAELGRLDLGGHLALAVPDAYTRSFHSPRLARRFGGDLPVFPPNAPYFNCGVMLVDLAGWREQGVAERALRWAGEYAEAFRFRDQDALNFALLGRWGPLELGWNFHEIPGTLRSWEAEHYDLDELRRAFRSPNLVHFVSSPKPWHARCESIHVEHFLNYVRRSSWRAFRPPVESGAIRWWHRLLRQPHARFEWNLWRGAVHSRDPLLLWRAFVVMALHPWIVFTYPLSRAVRAATRLALLLVAP